MSSSQTTTASATTTTSHSPLTDHNHTHTHMNHHNHSNNAASNNVGHHLTNDQNSSPTKNRLNNLKHSLAATTGSAGCASTCENGNDETYNPKRMRLSESIENISNNTSTTNHVTTNNCNTTNDNSQVCDIFYFLTKSVFFFVFNFSPLMKK